MKRYTFFIKEQIMKKLLSISLLSASLLSGAGLSTIFSQGQKNFGFSVGSSSGFGNDYTVVGASFSYFVRDDIALGVGYQGYFGDDPKINEVSTTATYYYPFSEQYHPYIGAVYRHTFIDDPYEDYDVIGGRAGIAMSMGNNAYMSIGWIQEHRTHGEDSSDEGYPEVSVGFTF
jgi:hypothetical protein